MNHSSICALVLFVATVWSAAAVAQTEPTSKARYSPYYSGASWEVSGRAAATFAQDKSGWALDLGLRQAFPMGLADTRISYRYDEIDLAGGPFFGHTLHIGGGFHPMFFFILRNDFLGWVLSAIYLEAGLGVQLGIQETEDAVGSVVSFVWSAGAGVDVPLMDPDIGYAPWLNVVYRYQWAAPHVDDLAGTHGIFVGLGWRTNGLLF